jgi:predicted AlkP superfamily pyrophosphatase or phosphodiesterase
MNRVVVLNVVALTKSLIGNNTPHLQSLLDGSANIRAITPAVTCSVQSTYLTGKLPSEHGIVGNGWYFRDLSEIWFWRQSNRLVQSDKIWHAARRRNPNFTCANTFWWFNMLTDVTWSITPRPIYCADGRKLPDCYSDPPELRDSFNQKFGQFPLFRFWGPATSIESSEWIGKAAMAIEQMYRPTLHLVYLPHLDYALQKVGPHGDIAKDLNEIDALCGKLIDYFLGRECKIVVLSEYGMTAVDRVIYPNRILRKAGYLALKVDLNREFLDPGRCKAFAVVDHQIAHIYIRNPVDVLPIKELFEAVPAVENVLDDSTKSDYGIDHDRSGDLVLISRADAWFAYYFWEDDSKAPDYARTVDIHRKPGYDPCELFIDPAIRFPKLKMAQTLLKKYFGFRYLMEFTPLAPGLVKGSHGRVTNHDDEGPIFMTTEPKLLRDSQLTAIDVFDLLLAHVFSI